MKLPTLASPTAHQRLLRLRRGTGIGGRIMPADSCETYGDEEICGHVHDGDEGDEYVATAWIDGVRESACWLGFDCKSNGTHESKSMKCQKNASPNCKSYAHVLAGDECWSTVDYEYSEYDDMYNPL